MTTRIGTAQNRNRRNHWWVHDTVTNGVNMVRLVRELQDEEKYFYFTCW